jgi:hypothetical protein
MSKYIKENNDKALKYLLRNDEKEEFQHFSKLVDNFNYFKGRIVEENYQVVLQGLSKLLGNYRCQGAIGIRHFFRS